MTDDDPDWSLVRVTRPRSLIPFAVSISIVNWFYSPRFHFLRYSLWRMHYISLPILPFMLFFLSLVQNRRWSGSFKRQRRHWRWGFEMAPPRAHGLESERESLAFDYRWKLQASNRSAPIESFSLSLSFLSFSFSLCNCSLPVIVGFFGLCWLCSMLFFFSWFVISNTLVVFSSIDPLFILRLFVLSSEWMGWVGLVWLTMIYFLPCFPVVWKKLGVVMVRSRMITLGAMLTPTMSISLFPNFFDFTLSLGKEREKELYRNRHLSHKILQNNS